MLYAFVSNIVAAVIVAAMDIFLNVVVGIILDCFFVGLNIAALVTLRPFAWLCLVY